MRDFFDAILDFIVTTSLTNDEFATTTSEIPIYDQATYDDLARVLNAREAISTVKDRLISYYKARGFDPVPAKTGNSNIFIGGPLCD